MDSSESVIRRMTRLAVQHGAVNLAQGFTDEPVAFDLVWGAFTASLGGTEEGIERLARLTLRQIATARGLDAEGVLDLTLRDVLRRLQGDRDQFNQYSFPFGLRDLRVSIADYTARLYGFRPDPETEITVSLGATEGLASALAGLCRRGDGVIIVQPFHEMYPSQARIFGLRPIYVTLREDADARRWELDRDEWRRAGDRARVLILNTPHNPTGKVFSDSELSFIAELCQERDLAVVTDEIYEHLVYDGRRHRCLAGFPGMRDRTVVVNSISKTGNATGWRVGWIIAPPGWTTRIRGIHDTLVIQAPTPLQKGAIGLLAQPRAFFERLRASYVEKGRMLTEALERAGFLITPPEGSYYLFADYTKVAALTGRAPMAAALHLIETSGVAAVPGDNFYGEGREGDRYLRFAFCRSLASLREAARRLDQLPSA